MAKVILPYNVALKLMLQIRRLIILFMIGLVVSGLTVFPIEWQLSLAHGWIQHWQWDNVLARWIELSYSGIHETNASYPFMSYGTDWLGFAHLIIAIAFIGPLRDPLRNRWVIEFGIIACLAILPFAFIAGEIRGIPLYWRLIDCMFGIFGGFLLWRCYSKIKQFE